MAGIRTRWGELRPDGGNTDPMAEIMTLWREFGHANIVPWVPFYRCDEVRSHFGSRQINFAPRASASAGLVRARVRLAMSGAGHSWEECSAASGAGGGADDAGGGGGQRHRLSRCTIRVVKTAKEKEEEEKRKETEKEDDNLTLLDLLIWDDGTAPSLDRPQTAGSASSSKKPRRGRSPTPDRPQTAGAASSSSKLRRRRSPPRPGRRKESPLPRGTVSWEFETDRDAEKLADNAAEEARIALDEWRRALEYMSRFEYLSRIP